MPQFIALTCLKCGGKLQIRDDKKDFTCPYCGTSHLFNPDDGMVSIMKIEKSLKNVERGVDKTAAELALRRLQKELSNMPDLEEIKNEIWGRKDYVNLALHKCLSNLLVKQNPNRAVSDPIAIFVSTFSESELRAKFFSPLTDEELMQMIDYCDDQKKRTNGNYRPEFYEYLQRNFQIMIKIKELIKSLRRT